MGLGLSKPKLVSREKLLQSTEGTQTLVNEMFNIMISQLTPDDFLKLGNPNQCKQFVFMMADSIQKMFVALKIQPKVVGGTGVVLFEEAKRLQQETPQTRNWCLYVAYFYIRIFQIFGALAISVLDDPNAGPVLAATRYAPPQRFKQPIYGIRQTGGANPVYFSDRKSKASEFYQLRDLFNDPTELIAQPGPTKKLLRQFSFRDNPNFLLIPDRVSEGRRQNLKLNLDGNIQILANMIPSRIGLLQDVMHYKLSLTNFQYKDPYTSDKLTLSRINNQLKNYKEEFEIYSEDKGHTWLTIRKREPVVNELESIILTIQAIVAELEANPTITLKDVAAAKKQGKQVRIQEGERPVVPTATRDISSPFVPKPLQHEYIIGTLKAMTTNRPVAFCVARALQLIDANTLFQAKPATATSGICFGRFESRPGSAPETGKTMDKVVGLHALDQLYYTMPVVEKEKSQVLIAKEDTQEYADFLKQISGLFGKQIASGGLDKIQATENPACVAAAAKQYLTITDPKSIQSIVQVVNQLFARQLVHTQKVIAFYKNRLFRIFNYRNPATGGIEKKYTIHPKLLTGGLEELGKVSKEARELLLDYYTGCEKQYQEGVKLVLQSRTR